MDTGHSTPGAAVFLDVGQSLNASYGPHLGPVPLGQPALAPSPKTKTSDPTGEGYYVIAVFLVYGMSIVLLIASHIRRKHSKLAIDKEICKYLQEFQVVKETSNRDSYRDLKRSIIAKLSRDKHCARKGVANLALPMAAVALPTDPPSKPDDNEEEDDDDYDDNDDVQVAGDASEDRSRSYTDLDTLMEEEELDFEGHQSPGRYANEQNGYHGNQIPGLRRSGIDSIAMGRNVYCGYDEFQALDKAKQAELISRFAFDGNGYHVIRIPEVSEREPEVVGPSHGNQSIRVPSLRRHVERGDGPGNGGRTRFKVETEVSGLRSSMTEYTEAVRQLNVGASRDPRWILLPLLLENRMRTERQDENRENRMRTERQDEDRENRMRTDRQDNDGRKPTEEAEEKKKNEQDEETEKYRNGESTGAECSAGRADPVDSYTYVL